MNSEFVIKTEDELEGIFGEPHELVKEKSQPSLDDNMMEFIRRSPLIFMSTISTEGQVDISPKGDAPGFVQIDDEGNLLVPDRPGNRLVLGFRNMLHNNNVGIIFVIPNTRETLRVKGRATISNDPSLLESLSANGKPALLTTHIELDECFFHCGKALIRSKAWKPETWESYNESLMVKNVASKIDGDKNLEKAIEAEIEQNYRNELY
jgi:PPOX class probable FMN-dependent enzyme